MGEKNSNVIYREETPCDQSAQYRGGQEILRVISIGSIPPEWGGATRGGVASVHGILASQWAEFPNPHGVKLIGLLATNRPADARLRPPDNIPLLEPPSDRRLERSWYHSLLAGIAPDVVIFFHIGHRWSRWHTEAPVHIPAVGSIHSWTQITFRKAEDSTKARKNLTGILPEMAALIFPSRHTLEEGLELGFSYPCPTLVIPNPVQSVFIEEAAGMSGSEHERSGALVFRGIPLFL